MSRAQILERIKSLVKTAYSHITFALHFHFSLSFAPGKLRERRRRRRSPGFMLHFARRGNAADALAGFIGFHGRLMKWIGVEESALESCHPTP
jgi:hypothetical protein